jgi:site-specific recombinase XerD
VRDDATTVSHETLRVSLKAAQRRANLKTSAARHVLRHTFCSHLAMNGASVTAIQRPAGHRQLSTTTEHMHLSRRTEAMGAQ